MSAVTPLRRRQGSLELHHPEPQDGGRIWALVRQTGNLELNSAYAYLLLATHFSQTCVVAEQDGELLGFVVGYRPPNKPKTLFVWQVGVAPKARRRGLGRKMLAFLMDTPGPNGARFLEATATEDNRASLGLFRSLAEAAETEFQETVLFPEDIFPEPHENEVLLRIGPFETDSLKLEIQEAS